MTTNGGTRTNWSAWPFSPKSRWIRRGITDLLALAFPPRCLLCGTSTGELSILCARCEQALPSLAGVRCQRCQEPLESVDFDLCQACGTRERWFDLVRALGPYEGGWGELVRALKFDRELAIARYLVGRLARYIIAEDPFGPIDVISYVPMTRADRRKRGFNQARLLASGLGKRLGIPVQRLLAKQRQTQPQADLAARERRRNLRGAFRLVKSGEGIVLVIDDIFTTGSTVEECSRMLKSGGYKGVFVLAVARA